MPLIKSASKDAFVSNLKAELAAGKPRAQAAAIAYDVQRRSHGDGGAVQGYALGGLSQIGRLPMRPFHNAMVVHQPHVGAIRGATGGRADARPMAVKPNSYVLPSALVSGLGQGNSDAGHRIIDTMFSGGPYNSRLPTAHRSGLGIPRPPGITKFATGGLSQQPSNELDTPIYAADGEHVLSPEQVAMAGDGDMQRGHDRIDAWVDLELKKIAKTIKDLPRPRKS